MSPVMHEISETLAAHAESARSLEHLAATTSNHGRLLSLDAELNIYV